MEKHNAIEVSKGLMRCASDILFKSMLNLIPKRSDILSPKQIVIRSFIVIIELLYGMI